VENALDELCCTKMLSMVAPTIARMIATQHAMMKARIVVTSLPISSNVYE
jgi:hypothetical protein